MLEKLKDHPLVADVLTYRQYAKLKSTYADGLLKVIDPDGRIRTSFQMTVTATGRLSSTEPNLQNIPTRTELGSKMREMFVAAPGHVLVDADYSQIELRLLAHISGDTAMQQAFLSGADFHTVTAARVFHVPQDQVTHQMRSRAKAVNFGIVYGISAFSLSQDIGVTVQEAKEYMDRYFCHLYRGEAVYDGRGGQGPGAGLCGDPVAPPPGFAGAEKLQLQYAVFRRAGGPEYAHPGHGGGHHQAGHGPGPQPPGPGRPGRPADHAGPR